MKNTTMNSSSFDSLKKWGLSLAFFAVLFAFLGNTLQAQTSGNIWDDEEDDEEEMVEEKALVDARPERKDEARIWLNDDAFDPNTEEITVHRNDTLVITVRDLAPATSVVIQAAKGGINLSKKAFYANNKGELDLEIHLGNKKMKGQATLYYTPSDGKRKTKEVHIIVD